MGIAAQLCLAAAIISLAAGDTRPWAVGLYPHINTGAAACSRAATNSLLCDPDGLLSMEEADQVCIITLCHAHLRV